MYQGHFLDKKKQKRNVENIKRLFKWSIWIRGDYVWRTLLAFIVLVLFMDLMVDQYSVTIDTILNNRRSHQSYLIRKKNITIMSGISADVSKYAIATKQIGTKSLKEINNGQIDRIDHGENDLRKNGVFLPLPEEIRSKVFELNEARKQLVKDICERKSLHKQLTLNNVKKIKEYTNLAVDDKHKLLYCYIPKVACTSWKVKLAIMIGKSKEKLVNTHPSPVDIRDRLPKVGIKLLSTYTPEQIKYRIENYYKFIFVRDPLERIVSAYRSKFEKRQDNKEEIPFFYSQFASEIRKVARENKNDTKSSITFEEFVKYAIHRTKIKQFTNEHWEQYNKICHLCLINYNFIGKFSSDLLDDISYVLHDLSQDKENYWFPNVTAPQSSNKYLYKYYSEISRNLIDELEHGYKLDIELFGYEKGLSERLNKTKS